MKLNCDNPGAKKFASTQNIHGLLWYNVLKTLAGVLLRKDQAKRMTQVLILFQRNLRYTGACCPGDFLLRNQQYVRRIVVENLEQTEIPSYVKDLDAEWRKLTYWRKETTPDKHLPFYFLFVEFYVRFICNEQCDTVSKPTGLSFNSPVVVQN